MHSEWRGAAEITTAIQCGEISARTVTEAALQRIARRNSGLGAFTQVTNERALKTRRPLIKSCLPVSIQARWRGCRSR